MLELQSKLEQIDEAVRGRGDILATACGDDEGVAIVDLGHEYVVWRISFGTDPSTYSGAHFPYHVDGRPSSTRDKIESRKLAWQNFVNRAPQGIRVNFDD